MRSLRTRLLVGMISGMALLLIIFGLFVYTAMARALREQFDASLTATARTLAAAPELEEGEFELELDERLMVEFQPSERPDYFQFWLGDGTVLARSPSLGERYELPCFAGPIEAPVHRPVELPNGRQGRAVGIEYRPSIEDGGRTAEQAAVRLVVGRDAGELAAELRLLRLLLLSGGFAAVMVALLVGGLVVRQGLRPLSLLASRIAAIREDDLTERVQGDPLPTEMLPVVGRLNQLLGRLESAFERERLFTRDVAHQLRTPVAGMRSSMEVALSRSRRPDEYRESLSDCLAIAKRMQTMVEDLLMLARLEAGQAVAASERVVLTQLVDSCWRPFEPTAAERHVAFENRVAPDVSTIADHGILSMVLSNLLANASEYTNEGGSIWVCARFASGSVEMAVSNTGCHLSADEVCHVFDSFWRADPSRTDTDLHCGLGLALVQRGVSALGGTATTSLTGDDVFTVRLTLPAGG